MDNKIKVLRILHRPSVSGPTFHAAYLTAGLSDSFETKLICGQILDNEVDGTYLFKENGVEFQTITKMKRSINPLQDLLALMEIRKIIKEFKPDIVHTHAAKSGTLGRLAAITTGVENIVHTFHGNVFSGYFNRIVTNVFIAIERFLAKKSNAIIAISNIQKKELVSQYKIATEEKTHVINLGLLLDKFRSSKQRKPKADGERIYIGIIGRITSIKNHHLFIDLIDKLKNEHNINIGGIVVGEGDMEEEIKQYARSINLATTDNIEEQDHNDVVFTGAIKDIKGILEKMDILALTSNNEGTPVTLLEGQAAGLPILSTNVGGVEDITQSTSALLSPKGDLAALVKNALRMNEELNVFTSKAYINAESVITQFSSKRLVSDIEKLYNELLDRL